MPDALASGWRSFAAAVAKPRLAQDGKVRAARAGWRALAMDAGEKWITVHGNKEGPGSPVLLGANGEVKGGLGGKFTGKNISEVRGKNDHKTVAHSRVAELSKKYPEAGSPKVEENEREGALAYRSGNNINLSPKAWTKEGLEKYAKEWDGMMNDPSVGGVMTHEFGHLLASKLEDKIGFKKFWKIVYGHLGYSGKGPLNIVNNQTSAYGAENIFEFMAESFVAYETKKSSAGMFSDHAQKLADAMWSDLIKTARKT
jgi:hypothetical protein